MSMNLTKEDHCVINCDEDMTVIDFGGDVSLAEKEAIVDGRQKSEVRSTDTTTGRGRGHRGRSHRGKGTGSCAGLERTTRAPHKRKRAAVIDCCQSGTLQRRAGGWSPKDSVESARGRSGWPKIRFGDKKQRSSKHGSDTTGGVASSNVGPDNCALGKGGSSRGSSGYGRRGRSRSPPGAPPPSSSGAMVGGRGEAIKQGLQSLGVDGCPLESSRVVEINGSEEEHRAAYDQWIAIVGGKGAVVDLSSQRGKGAATGEARLVQSVATVVVEARLGQTKGTTGNLPALDSEAYEEDEEV
ncbi:hypothetical protein BHE74_00006710 [Ensete ventricosum]|nr:hypothetical protein BHE74_00006710 [Ensete ventricosum]